MHEGILELCPDGILALQIGLWGPGVWHSPLPKPQAVLGGRFAFGLPYIHMKFRAPARAWPIACRYL